MAKSLLKLRVGIDINDCDLDAETCRVSRHPFVESLTDGASLTCHEHDMGTCSHALSATMRAMRPATSIVLIVLLALIMGAFVINIFMRGLV
jgi:hypothetical protein